MMSKEEQETVKEGMLFRRSDNRYIILILNSRTFSERLDTSFASSLGDWSWTRPLALPFTNSEIEVLKRIA